MFNFALYGDWLLRPHCLLCGAGEAENIGICQPCLNDLPWHPASSCPQCGLASNGLVCGACLSHPPHYDATQAVFTYAYPVDAMLQRFKYAEMLNLGHTFGQLLAQNTASQNIDLIIPMPMHPKRIQERGFNQALEIARHLDKSKLDTHSAIRQKLTPPQAGLPLKERVKNIKGAFAVNADLTGKRIAIVDDVMTSGASLNELAKTLKKAGANHVECWVIGRTLPK